MEITCRLYSRHDMDLILLYKVYRVNLNKLIRMCVKAYLHHEDFALKPLSSIDAEKKYTYKKDFAKDGCEAIHFKNVKISISFSEKEDAECVELFKNILPGYRNLFIKQLLRYYINIPIMPHFLAKDYSKIPAFNNSKKLVDYPTFGRKRMTKKAKLTRKELQDQILNHEPEKVTDLNKMRTIESEILNPTVHKDTTVVPSDQTSKSFEKNTVVPDINVLKEQTQKQTFENPEAMEQEFELLNIPEDEFTDTESDYDEDSMDEMLSQLMDM